MLHTRLALVGAVMLLLERQAGAATTFGFTECVSNCVASSGCESGSAKCVCKAAQSDFLDTVVVCLFYHCKDEFRNVDDIFLKPVKAGCDADKRTIPKDDIEEAKAVASSLMSKMPKTTSTTPRTTTTAKTATTRTKASSSSSIPATVAQTISSSSSADVPVPPPTLLPAPTSTIDSPDSPTTTQGGQRGVPTDSSPFATLDSAGSHTGVGILMLLLTFALAFR
jgi:hypothetical protein